MFEAVPGAASLSAAAADHGGLFDLTGEFRARPSRIKPIFPAEYYPVVPDAGPKKL
jgi:hypothetical protein